jgi:DNA-binding NarL/FixJ family response regulator
MSARKPDADEGTQASAVRVALADDDVLLREGLASLLERSGFEIVASGERIGYLLKSRVTDVDEFIESVQRIARGGSVIDSALVKELVGARKSNDPLAVLTEREGEVLALMAEGRSNAGIGRRLWITEGTIEKHVRSILSKLDLPEGEDDHRRVLAVVTYLEAR